IVSEFPVSHADCAQSPWNELACAIAKFYRSPGPHRAAGSALLLAAADALALRGAADLARARGAALAVRRFLPRCVQATGKGPAARIAHCFAAVEPSADWLQNSAYDDASMGSGWLDNYGYIELLGPQRVFDSQTHRVGFLLIGPHRHYRDHIHPAEENYHIISGSAEWWTEATGWRVQAPCAAIHHAPGVRHATRTRDEPLLALYCWGGDIAPAARLTSVAGRSTTDHG
ncbi:MAG: dimethylsulfonioproprionate lyase family protein, partial [Beijerinckiaceae bacterium]